MPSTKLGRLSQELADLNPWWRTDAWAAADPDLQQARGSGLAYSTGCLDNLRQGGMYVLRGPRRVGKTVASKQVIERLTRSGVAGRAIVRVAVDGWSADDLRTMVQNVTLPTLADHDRRWWLIDEVTAVTGDWAATIKWLRDNLTVFRNATVIITGSNARDLTHAIGLWAGRRGGVQDADRTMLPIGFRSFVDLVSPTPPTGLPTLRLSDLRSSVARDTYRAMVPWLADMVRLWDRYLLHGGFPESVAAARRGDPIPPGLVDAMRDVIFKDVFRDSQSSVTATTSLFARLTEGMGNPVSRTNIGVDADMHQMSVARHIDYLINGYLAWACPQKDTASWIPLRKAQPKIYMVDPLIARLPHLQRAARRDVDPTVLNEMMLGLAVRRAAEREGHQWSDDEYLFYHRTPARKEIDFVSGLFGGAAIEGKFIEDGRWRGEGTTVNASGWKGILGTRNVLDVSDSNLAWAVPAGVLAYLIDA